MPHGPLVVLTRKKGASGWTVRVDPSSVRVGDLTLTVKGERIEEEMWEGEIAAPPEPDEQPQWVGSVAMRPADKSEVRPPADHPKPTPKKPWWKKLFGG